MGCLENARIVWFGEVDRTEIAAVGGKGASLSDMARAGLPIPPGFVICTSTFRKFLQEAGLEDWIIQQLSNLDVEDNARLEQVAEEINRKIEPQALSSELEGMILNAYRRLCDEHGGTAIVAVRSSAAAEDSQASSFAGQQETFLNIYGEACLLQHVQACWRSFFNPRAIFYRQQRGNLEDFNIAVVVQRMLHPEKAGVMFTVDPVQHRHDRLMIEAAWGLGETVVSGLVTPDNYVVDKATGGLVSKFIPRKPVMIIREESGVGVRQVDLPPEKAMAQVLSPAEITGLAALGRQIEAHFGLPQDVEWAIEDDHLYVLQSRPVTTL